MQGCLCGYFLSMLKKSIRRHHTSSTARDTMRIGQTNPALLSEQHRTHLLILFITLTTGAFTDEDVIRAPLGGSATFKFKVTRDMTVSLAEWSRCPNHKVFVFSPIHGLTILNNNYAGRLFAKSNHSVVLEKLQESDFVTYCYKLSTFPQGSLQGQMHLVKRTENGLPNTVIISVGCGMGLLVLCGIIAGVVCYKKRRSNLALNPGGLPSGQSNKPKSTGTQSEEEMQNEDHNYLKIT